MPTKPGSLDYHAGHLRAEIFSAWYHQSMVVRNLKMLEEAMGGETAPPLVREAVKLAERIQEMTAQQKLIIPNALWGLGANMEYRDCTNIEDDEEEDDEEEEEEE